MARPRERRAARPVAMLCVALFLGASFPADALRPAQLVAGLPAGTLILESSAVRCLMIRAWFAEEPAQQRQGLMFVEQMDEFEGMLFRYPQTAQINMWMKNTLIPLDMLFIDENNRVVNIAQRTTPLSERRLSSARPVTQVLELNAGFTARWAILPGNRLLLAE